MTYEQAIAQVKNGQRVKRSGWSNHYLKKGSDGEITTVYVRTTSAPYTATQEDMTTDDWATTT